MAWETCCPLGTPTEVGSLLPPTVEEISMDDTCFMELSHCGNLLWLLPSEDHGNELGAVDAEVQQTATSLGPVCGPGHLDEVFPEFYPNHSKVPYSCLGQNRPQSLRGRKKTGPDSLQVTEAQWQLTGKEGAGPRPRSGPPSSLPSQAPVWRWHPLLPFSKIGIPSL